MHKTMYCKYCGKEIDEDSCFCRYCGKEVGAETFPEENVAPKTEPLAPKAETIAPKTEVVVSTKNNNPLKVSILPKPSFKIQKKSVAQEVVANLKMAGVALVAWLVLLFFFWWGHQKDLRTTESSYFGESYYDDSWVFGESGLTIFEPWQDIYEAKVAEARTGGQEEGLRAMWDSGMISTAQYKKELKEMKEKARDFVLTESVKEKLTKEAKDERAYHLEQIKDNRKSCFEGDRDEWMRRSAIILLIVAILGRYAFKVVKWIVKNYSK